MSAIGLAQDVGLLENDALDEFTVPFGAWVDQSVDWIDNNLGWLLDAIEWPFTFLLTNLVDDFLIKISWFWIVLGFVLIGSLVRNVRVGLFAGMALAFCGLLGDNYWIETARTIGFILVAVLLCALIGIPVGVACGRIDGLWSVVRPVLDAMQVVHAFVYMLPFIFFFGIGEEAATMVTMVFALPPLIRLTNLGIRQVPEDVVEAARAYGAAERRVLFDVQLPLASPAIMTGLNQTLLLSISMLGIAAIMGAGGLGRLLFRAITNLDVGLAASAGLAFFLVAVVLDRISQPEDSDQPLLGRIAAAWRHRNDPSALLSRGGDEPSGTDGEAVAVTGRERTGLLLAAAGALVAAVATALPWGEDAGLISSHARAADTDLAGSDFNGVSASGGSWFGLIVLGLGVWILLAVVDTIRRRSRGGRYLSADGALIASLGMLGAVVAYLAISPGVDVASYSDGIGLWVAVVGAVLAVAGSVTAVLAAPFTPIRPLSLDIAWGRVIGAVIAGLVILGGTLAGWSFDAREESVITPELQAELDELEREAELNPAVALENANIIQNRMNQARRTERVINDAWTADGAGLGLLIVVLAGLALVLTVPAAGLGGADDMVRWRASAGVLGLGAALMIIAAGWIASLLRVADPGFVSGVGAFLVFVGGFFFLGSARGMVANMDRARRYEDTDTLLEREAAEDALEPVPA
ncbi:MAG: ABC transporter permease subunit [Acidimicrobiales bacterium]